MRLNKKIVGCAIRKGIIGISLVLISWNGPAMAQEKDDVAAQNLHVLSNDPNSIANLRIENVDLAELDGMFDAEPVATVLPIDSEAIVDDANNEDIENSDLPNRSERLALELAFQALNAADLILSLDCRSRSDCEEANPLFGKRPSAVVMIMAKAAAAGWHLFVSHKIWTKDPKYMRAWLYGSIVIYSGIVGVNLTQKF